MVEGTRMSQLIEAIANATTTERATTTPIKLSKEFLKNWCNNFKTSC
jgi:hypothetical protein